MRFNPGDILGNYRILGPLGAGGMGEVFRALDRRLEREVAIKALPESLLAEPAKLARFEREARILAALNHPGIAQIYGLEESSSGPLLIMELVEGATLADRLARGPLDHQEALTLFARIGEALNFAHERGIIHRDLKPANIKIATDGRPKILDFGLAKALVDAPQAGDSAETLEIGEQPTLLTRPGGILGTPPYMSPEQTRGEPVDRRTDIWAYGCCFFEALTGKRCFHGSSVHELFDQIRRSDPDWSSLPPETPSNAVVILQRSLEKRREDRPSSVGDIVMFLESDSKRLAAPTVPAGAEGEYPRSAAAGPAFARRLLAPAAGLTLALVLAFGLWIRQRPEPNGTLSPPPQPQAVTSSLSPVDPIANELYVRAQALLSHRTPEAMREGVRLLEEAGKADPKDARIHASLAGSLALFAMLDAAPPGDSLPRALSEARLAVGLDPRSAIGYFALGQALMQWEGDWSGAGDAFRRGLEIDPANASGRQWYAQYLLFGGNFEEGLKEAEAAIRLEPRNPIRYLTRIQSLFFMRRYDEAVLAGEAVLAAFPDWDRRDLVDHWLALIQYQRGDYDSAREALGRHAGDRSLAMESRRALVEAALGNKGPATEFLDRIENLPEARWDVALDAALLSWQLGDSVRAFRWLDRGCQARSYELLSLRSNPVLDPLRADPRFGALVRQADLPPMGIPGD